MQLVLMKGMSFRHKPTSLIRSHHYCIYSICSVSLSVCVVVSVGQEGIINNFDLVVDGLSSKASDTPRLIGAIVDLGYQSFEATYIYIYLATSHKGIAISNKGIATRSKDATSSYVHN